MYKDIINTQNIWQVIFLKGLAHFFFHRQMIFFPPCLMIFPLKVLPHFQKRNDCSRFLRFVLQLFVWFCVYHLNSINLNYARTWSFKQFCIGETWGGPSSFRIPSITGVGVTFCRSRYAQHGAQLMLWYSSGFIQHCLLTGSVLSGWKLAPILYKLLPFPSTQD